jgi:hypothetical protein
MFVKEVQRHPGGIRCWLLYARNWLCCRDDRRVQQLQPSDRSMILALDLCLLIQLRSSITCAVNCPLFSMPVCPACGAIGHGSHKVHPLIIDLVAVAVAASWPEHRKEAEIREMRYYKR